jgi:cob(I)alamin adenosyltransferase
MVEINVVYTKTGDDGKTSLTTDSRLLKSCPRIEAIGAVDELNSHLGLLIAHINNDNTALTAELSEIQNQLFNLGAELAMMVTEPQPASPCSHADDVKQLERRIDQMNTSLQPLTSFILPQGNLFIAHCHVTRSVCRRAERRLVELHQSEPLRPVALEYINRLSDYLFVLIRATHQQQSQPEILWQPRRDHEKPS